VSALPPSTTQPRSQQWGRIPLYLVVVLLLGMQFGVTVVAFWWLSDVQQLGNLVWFACAIAFGITCLVSVPIIRWFSHLLSPAKQPSKPSPAPTEADSSLIAAESELRKQAEQALSFTQEKFAKAFRASPDFITISSLKTGRFVEVNESFLTASGYTRAEVLGKTVFELGAWADRLDRAQLQTLLAQYGRVKDKEIKLRKKSGDVMIALLSAEVIELDGEPHMLAITKDITDRQRAEAEIRESQKKYQDLVESANSIILRVGLDGQIVFLNRYGQQFFGYQEADILGRNVIGTLVWERPESKQLWQQWIEQVCQSPEQYLDAELENTRSNGQKVWVKWSNKAILDDEGELTEILSVGFDITDRKQAEAALQEKEQYLRLIIDNIPQQVFWKDTDLKFRGCNQNWAKAAQLNSPDEIIGKTDYDVVASCEVAEQLRAQDRQVIETDTPQLHIISRKLRTVDGEPVWLDISKVPIHDSDRNVIGVLGVIDDITLRKYAEDALRSEQEKSERLLLNVLPQPIADRLKQGLGLLDEPQTSSLIAESFDEVTILFADIVNFTTLSSNISASDLVGLLNRIFLVFDDLCEKHGLEKIKTIGDAYMVVGGLPTPQANHVEAIADMALDMQQAIAQFTTQQGYPISVRIGINSGSVIAGVIGKKKFNYDLWGDAVNSASRMESHGMAGKIQVSEATYERLKDNYVFEPRGVIEVKGKGEMTTYWLIGKK
jgi:PAS domain S-box-containing protein